MSAASSFSIRVGLLNRLLESESCGAWSVDEAENGYINLNYKNHALLAISAKGKTQKELMTEISAIYGACLMFSLLDE